MADVPCSCHACRQAFPADRAWAPYRGESSCSGRGRPRRCRRMVVLVEVAASSDRFLLFVTTHQPVAPVTVAIEAIKNRTKRLNCRNQAHASTLGLSDSDEVPPALAVVFMGPVASTSPGDVAGPSSFGHPIFRRSAWNPMRRVRFGFGDLGTSVSAVSLSQGMREIFHGSQDCNIGSSGRQPSGCWLQHRRRYWRGRFVGR